MRYDCLSSPGREVCVGRQGAHDKRTCTGLGSEPFHRDLAGVGKYSSGGQLFRYPGTVRFLE